VASVSVSDIAVAQGARVDLRILENRGDTWLDEYRMPS